MPADGLIGACQLHPDIQCKICRFTVRARGHSLLV
jgi:hypothetical protein